MEWPQKGAEGAKSELQITDLKLQTHDFKAGRRWRTVVGFEFG